MSSQILDDRGGGRFVAEPSDDDAAVADHLRDDLDPSLLHTSTHKYPQPSNEDQKPSFSVGCGLAPLLPNQ